VGKVTCFGSKGSLDVFPWRPAIYRKKRPARLKLIQDCNANRHPPSPSRPHVLSPPSGFTFPPPSQARSRTLIAWKWRIIS